MPITARLSKRFYDRLGDEVANELVEWMNQVDAGSRDELRALNEVNFARFDAKLEQRTAELEARIDHVATSLEARIEQVAASLDARIDQLGTTLNARIDQLGTTLNARIDQLATTLNARIDQSNLELRNDVQARLTEQTRWMVLTWGVLLAAVVGLYTR